MITADTFLASHKIVIPESHSQSHSDERQSADCSPTQRTAVDQGENPLSEKLDGTVDEAVIDDAAVDDAAVSTLRGRVDDRVDDTEHVCNALNDDDIDACREAALRLLDAAPRSSGGLKQRLMDKEFAEPVIDEVIARLQRVLLINDEEYAQSAVRYCLSRNLGARFTERELLRKGVDRALAQRLVTEAADAGDFVDAAYELGRTVLRKTRGMDPVKRKRRFWSAGGRKGHSPDIIRQVANELFDNR
ncbi:regulatory protein RecX [Bifidobacterium aquikefiricola]|uniref:Regulatory protein RecX n=1 Tax=Bifidobacterium aquikefiricola TaxID=3059038 RepID=A0AB39U4A8_9BIFI